MAEPIKPISGEVISKFIRNLDKKATEQLPSIFLQPQDTEENYINDDFVYKQLYT